jgi:hypothetical protein
MFMDSGFLEYGLAAVLGAVGAAALTIWTFLADGTPGSFGTGR